MERPERLEGVEEPRLVPDGVLIGYARVSTTDQNLEAQTRQLVDAGCYDVYADHGKSGATMTRPELEKCLRALQPGNTLVVTKLDRLGRSVRNLKEVVESLQQRGIGLKALSQGIDTTTPGGRLFFHMLAAIAEFEHDLIVERTQDGLAAARARGRKGGGRFKMTATKARQARAMYDEKSYTVQQIAETFGVSRGTIYRHLAQDARPM